MGPCVFMATCRLHRWSTIKRWKLGDAYFVIQRCRRCDEWIRREIRLSDNKLNMNIRKFEQHRIGHSGEIVHGETVNNELGGTSQMSSENSNPHDQQDSPEV